MKQKSDHLESRLKIMETSCVVCVGCVHVCSVYKLCVCERYMHVCVCVQVCVCVRYACMCMQHVCLWSMCVCTCM